MAQEVTALLERRCVESASRVILNTPRLFDDFCRHYPGAETGKFAVIPNGFDPELLAEVAAGPSAEERRATPTKLCHPGTVYAGRDLLPVVEALERLAGNGFEVILDQVGNVEREKLAALERFARERGITPRIRLHGRATHQQTLRRMSEADLFLVSQPHRPLQVPGKLYEMLVFRKPILGLTGQGATADLIERFQLGVVANPEEPAEIAGAIERLIRETPRGNTQWEEALVAHDGRRLTEQLAGLFDQVC